MFLNEPQPAELPLSGDVTGISKPPIDPITELCEALNGFNQRISLASSRLRLGFDQLIGSRPEVSVSDETCEAYSVFSQLSILRREIEALEAQVSRISP